MIYTECKWHLGSEKPQKQGWYVIVWGAANSCDAHYDGSRWTTGQDIRFWSEQPTELTQGENDYRAWIGISGRDGPAPDFASFAAGCKYARESK